VQFAAGDDDRPVNTDPARVQIAHRQQSADRRVAILVVVQALVVILLVQRRVEDRNDAAFHREGVGNLNGTAGIVHEIADGAGNGRLAVAGWSMNENRFTADDGRTDRVEQFLAQHQVPKRGLKRFRYAANAGDGLPVALLDVIIKRHGGSADIGALPHRVVSSRTSQVRKGIDVTHFAYQVAARDLQAFLVLQEFQTVADDLEGQTQKLRQVAAEHLS